MKHLILISVLVSFVFASLEEDQKQWTNFKNKHGKVYKNIQEEKLRFSIFQQNLRAVEEHNREYAAGKTTYSKAANQFADLTKEEILSYFKRQNASRPHIEKKSVYKRPINAEIRESIDWRDYGAVSKVKNQGECSSCWAFSITGVLESFYYLKNKEMITFSEQQLLDCSTDNYGCFGGWQGIGMYYIKENGIQSDSSYPYEEKVVSCRYNESAVVAKIEDFVEIEDVIEDDLIAAVGLLGPISVALDADDLVYYQGGVYSGGDECSKVYTNHAALAVGYGKDEKTGLDYWLVKNSWGENWGEKGYFRIKRGANECGIATDNVYPVL